jgi:hypothetical protein
MTVELEERPDAHHWIFQDHRITQLLLDLSSLRLQTWTLQASAEIRLAVQFEFLEPDGVSRAINPEEPEQVSPVLSIVGRGIDTMTITRAGELRIVFSDGSTIVAKSHSRFEAWEIQGAGALEGLQYLAVPGGGQSWR